MIIYPKKLKIDDSIGIVAVSDGANLSKIDYSLNNLRKLGFNIKETQSVRKSKHFTSTDGKTRAKEFMDLWKDDNIQLIISARGGEFLMEMLPYLDEYKDEILKYIPKWIQGFSDTSILLYYITTKYNIATIHAGNVGEFAMRKFHLSLENNIKFLTTNEKFIQNSFYKYEVSNENEDPESEYNLTEKVEYKSFQNKDNTRFSGRLIGGCIDAITILLGTKYDNTVNFCNEFNEGMIWYIDNYELNALELRRKLWQMREAGWFNNANGFLIGRSLGGNKVGEYGFLDAIEYSLGDMKVPVIYDIDIGHLPPQFTLINGSFVTFNYTNGKANISQELV